MKKIILIRHADAGHNQLTDKARRLSSYGKEQIHILEEKIVQLSLPDSTCVMVSDARRTLETFNAIRSFFKTEHVIISDQLYLADKNQLLSAIQSTNNSFSHLVIIAHNPGLEDLVYTLTNKEIIFTTADIQILAIPSEDWKHIDAHLDICLQRN